MEPNTVLALSVVFLMLLVCFIGFVMEVVNLIFSAIVLFLKFGVKLAIIGVVLVVGYYGYRFFI